MFFSYELKKHNLLELNLRTLAIIGWDVAAGAGVWLLHAIEK